MIYAKQNLGRMNPEGGQSPPQGSGEKMREIKVLYKMPCGRCVDAIDGVSKFVKMCGLENKVSIKNILIENESDAKRFGFNPPLSPMIFINGKYIGSGKVEVCGECTAMSGSATECGLPLNKKVFEIMKSEFCAGIKCGC